MGLLDITEAPYFADPNGNRDSTKAIQQAVIDARDQGLICFFPEGSYVISDTLSAPQTVTKRVKPTSNAVGTRHYDAVTRPMILMGSTKGKRPVIRLSNDARGFDDPAHPKKAIWIWAQSYFDGPGQQEPVWGKEQANISFNHFFFNIDIDVRGHPGAIGIRHAGSQGSSLMNSRIYAEGAYAGMNNCCGQGGGTYNIEVIGGKYGIEIDTECRFPTLISCMFSGQTDSTVQFTGRQVLLPALFVGCRFTTAGPTVVDVSSGRNHGGLLLIDCLIEMSNGGTIVLTKGEENISIENTYVLGADTIHSDGASIGGSPGWTLLEQFSTHSSAGVHAINGRISPGKILVSKPVSAAPSYETIHQRHFGGMPSFEDKDAVNVKSFGAKGDGATDDTEAFRQAIAASDKVFVPKGNFKLSGTLELGPQTRLFGLARSFSSIGEMDSPHRNIETNTAPLPETVLGGASAPDAFTLSTVDDAKASPGLFLLAVQGKVGWKSGVGIWFLASGAPSFSGNGAGKFYGLRPMGGQFILDGIKLPISFYALNVERVKKDPQSEIRNCSHIRIYYFKVESGTIHSGDPLDLADANTPCRISNSQDISIYCMYGAVFKLVGRPMLEIVDSRKVKVYQLKSFRPGDYPHIRETRGEKILEIPSVKTVSLFIRD